MRIIIIDSLIGNEYTINLCKELKRVVDNITLVLPKNREISLLPGIDIKFWAPSKESNASKIKKIIDYPISLIRIFLLIKFDRKCIVHFQFFRRNFDAYFFVLLSILGVKVIYTAHNILPHEKRKLDLFRFSLVYKSATRIIVHSKFIKHKLINNFAINSEKIKIIPHGNFDNYLPDVSISKEVAKEKLGISKSDRVILFFGFIREYKGLDLLLDAFEIANKQNDRLVLLIAGSIDSNLKNLYEQKIFKLKDNVKSYFRFIENEEIPFFFSAADLVILPYKDIDHSGIIHLAYSFSKPVIGTNVGDFSEIIEENKSGRVLYTITKESLAELIIDTFMFQDLNKMGTYSKYLNDTKYSWKSIAEKTKDVYLSVVR